MALHSSDSLQFTFIVDTKTDVQNNLVEFLQLQSTIIVVTKTDDLFDCFQVDYNPRLS